MQDAACRAATHAIAEGIADDVERFLQHAGRRLRREEPGPTKLQLARALRAIGCLSRARRIEDCRPPMSSGERSRCGDRLCSQCGWRWRRDVVARLLTEVARWESTATSFTTISVSAATARRAIVRFQEALAKFRRLFPRAFVGIVHLGRATRGGWLAHAHLVVDGHPDDVAPAVRRAWADAGANVGADFCELTRSTDATIRYAARGATAPPRDGRVLREWLAALHRKRLPLRHGRAIHEEEDRNVTPRRTGHLGRKILTWIASLPLISTSELRRRITPSQRFELEHHLDDLRRRRLIKRVRGERGVLWIALAHA